MGARNRIATSKASLSFSSGDVSAPAANTAATVTYAAIPGKAHVISGLVAQTHLLELAAGVSPVVTITDGGTTVFSGVVPFVAGAVDGDGMYHLHLEFPQPKRASVNSALVISMPANGGASVNRLNILGHWTEMP